MDSLDDTASLHDKAKRLRKEWLDAESEPNRAATTLARTASARTIGLSDGASATFSSDLAEVEALRARARSRWLEYQDASTELQTEQHNEQMRTTNKLARAQAWLAGAIALASAIQAADVIREWVSK